MTREQEAEYLKQRLAELLNDDKSNQSNPIVNVTVTKQLFIEMAFCFIAKHGK